MCEAASWAAAKPSPLMRPQPGNPGRRIGVYGMGEIGRKIAARVAAFETEVGYFSRSQHDVPYQYLPSLEALAEWCSVLMIAVRAGADTHHAVDAGILRKLGTDGYVVNISRGSVIDQQALVAALDRQDHRRRRPRRVREGAACAGCADRVPNVVLTPHIGGHTLESHVAMQDCVIANLEAFFAGKPLPYEVRAHWTSAVHDHGACPPRRGRARRRASPDRSPARLRARRAAPGRQTADRSLP